MVDKSDALIREVDEELRREQLEKLWEKYSNHAFALAALIVVGVGGYKLIESRRIAAAEAAGAHYEEALSLAKAGKTAEASTAFEALSTDGPRGYKALSQIQLAGEYLKAGKTSEALSAFETLGRDGSADELLTGYARLQAASLRVSDADWTEMENRLNDLAGFKSPWRQNARELLGLAALKAGKLDEARKWLSLILGDSPQPSQPQAERVQVLLNSVVTAELAKKSAGAPASEKPGEPSKPVDAKTEQPAPAGAAPDKK